MRSYGSGRRRTRNMGKVELVPRLDIRWLRRTGHARPAQERTEDISWTDGHGHDLARCLVTHKLRPDGAGQLYIRGSTTVYAQKIEVVALPMRYGGFRLYYICPRLGHRCEVLYLYGGIFASRQAHRLTYQSQSDGLRKRLRSRAEVLKSRALGTNGHRRPRGHNRVRLERAARAAAVTHTEAWIAQLQVLFGSGRKLQNHPQGSEVGGLTSSAGPE